MNTTVVVFACVILLSPSLFAQFEGVVRSNNVTTDETGEMVAFEMTMWLKPDMLRIENSSTPSAPRSVMIYRNDRRVIWMLNDEDKSYFEIRQEGVPDFLGEIPRAEKSSLAVKKTGRKRKILGFPCEQVMVTRDDQVTEIWGTPALNDLNEALRQTIGQDPALSGDDWNDELTRMGLFPLISVTRIEGKVAESQEVTRIERKKLLQYLFEIPEGFQRHKATDVFDGIQREKEE
jgi:hypothetical protein